MKAQLKFILPLLLLSFLLTNLNAQIVPPYRYKVFTMAGTLVSEYDKGSVTLKNGKVMKGDISVKKKDGNLKYVKLKKADGQELEFDPSMVTAYGLDTIDDVKDITIGKGWYLALKNGQTLHGKLSCTTVNGDTTKFSMKDAEKTTQEFLRTDVKAYGMDFNPKLDYMSGVVTLKNGKELRGQVAITDKGEFDVHIKTIFCSTDGSTQRMYMHSDLASFMQFEDGKMYRYTPYMEGMVKHIVDGKASLARNPFPTTENKAAGMLGKALTVVGAAAVSNAAGNVADKAAEHEIRQKLKNDEYKNLGEVYVDAQQKQNHNDSLRTNIMQAGLDAKVVVYAIEYVVLIEGHDPVIVNKKNYKDAIGGFLAEIDDYYTMPKKERNNLVDFDHIEKAVNYYNEHSPKIAEKKP
jgi:small nuclear ribonucleoprotein (snRNP)-like protein